MLREVQIADERLPRLCRFLRHGWMKRYDEHGPQQGHYRGPACRRCRHLEVPNAAA